jgi:tetratricopeptide (TPR) repeat protein
VWIFAFVVALLGTLFALSGVSDVLRAEPETTSPPIAATASAAAKTTTDVSATSEAPDTLHFAVSSLKLAVDSPETRCVYALGRNSPAECKQIALAAIPTAEEPSLGRMRYLLARASGNDPVGARAALETLAATSHPLAAMAHVRLSELLRDSDPQAALNSVDTLLRDSRWKTRLEPLRAVLLNRLGRTGEAESLLRDLVAAAPSNTSATPASMTLATMLASRGDLSSKKQALTLFRRIFTRLPGTQTGEQARQQAQQVLNSMPPAERNSVTLTFSDLMTQADSMMGFRGYDRALREYRALEVRASRDPDQACAARLGQGKALTALRKTGEVVRVLSKVASDCKDEEIRANAHYNVARAILRQGDALRAIGHYDAAVKLAPKSRLADDALFAAHQAYLELDDAVGARASLTTLLARTNSPADVRANARFALAWLERRGGNLDGALEQLTQLTMEGANETTEDLFGRAAYWHARTLLDKQDRAAASAEFVDLFRKRPLTYYAQQGLARLQEFDPNAAKLVLAELRDTSPKIGLWMAVEPELKTPEFERAVELPNARTRRVERARRVRSEVVGRVVHARHGASADVRRASASDHHAGATPHGHDHADAAERRAARLVARRLPARVFADDRHDRAQRGRSTFFRAGDRARRELVRSRCREPRERVRVDSTDPVDREGVRAPDGFAARPGFTENARSESAHRHRFHARLVSALRSESSSHPLRIQRRWRIHGTLAARTPDDAARRVD